MPERKVALTGGLNLQPSGLESDTLTTEPPGRGPQLGIKFTTPGHESDMPTTEPAPRRATGHIETL